MTKLKQQTIVVMVSVVGAIIIIGTVFVVNGSEYEDAWLYIAALWIVLMPALDLYLKKRNKSR